MELEKGVTATGWSQFEARKTDHMQLAMDEAMQANGMTGLDRVFFDHRGFPELNWNDISTATPYLSDQLSQRHPCWIKNFATPFFVSSMTAGHSLGEELNLRLARVCEKRGWPLAIGSQRRQLRDEQAQQEWKRLRAVCPRIELFGNLGLAQVIESSPDDILRLVDSLQAIGFFVHTNPLQEVLQREGTPNFAGGLGALERLAKKLPVPLLVKEVGCGLSLADFNGLKSSGVAIVDVSGLGGTHWGRIEGGRIASDQNWQRQAALTFSNWGISTVDSLLAAMPFSNCFDVWASGGVRSGLDAAKLLGLGARFVGIAKPAMQAALEGEEKLNLLFCQFEQELRTAMFCTGSRTLVDLRGKAYVK